MDRIKPLLTKLRTILASEENQRRHQIQERLGRREIVHPTPFNTWSLTEGFPIIVQNWCRHLGRDLDLEKIALETGPISSDFACEMIEFQLLQKIEKFRTDNDDFPISPRFCTNFGMCWLYQKGFLGERYHTDANTGAWIADPILKEESDLDKLEIPRYSFDNSLHEARVATFSEILDGEFPIIDDALPPGMGGALFHVASTLRGTMEILLDIKERPKFVHRLMDFIVEAILAQSREAQRVRGTDTSPKETKVTLSWAPPLAWGGEKISFFGVDEVSCDMFSPGVYEEFIFPYECRAAAAFDSIYYHSCGNLTPIFSKIVEIPNVHRIHVSPWSDLAVAIKATAGRVVLEKHLNPLIDLDKLSREEMRSYVKQVTDLGTDYPLEMVVEAPLGSGLASGFSPGGQLFREIFYEETREAS